MWSAFYRLRPLSSHLRCFRRAKETYFFTRNVVPRRASPKFLFSTEAGQGESTVTTVRRGLWRVVRVVLLATGAVVWIAISMSSLKWSNVKTLKTDMVGGLDSKHQNDMKEKMFNFFDIKEEKVCVKEFGEKVKALMNLWDKVREEEAIIHSLGQDPYFCGLDLNCERPVSKNEEIRESGAGNEKKWKMACFVKGLNAVGRLESEFQWVETKWVPLSVRLELLEKTGNVLVDVSAPPPNGLTQFTRLSRL